jgi:hypothetical protein
MSFHTISTDLLQALLSPDASQRQAAEAQLAQLSAEQCCTELLQALQQPQPQTLQQQHLVQLAAVLLRREIIALSDAAQVESLIEPLLLLLHSNSTSTALVAAVGNCLAEICASLQWLDSTTSIAAVQRILQVVSTLAHGVVIGFALDVWKDTVLMLSRDNVVARTVLRTVFVRSALVPVSFTHCRFPSLNRPVLAQFCCGSQWQSEHRKHIQRVEPGSGYLLHNRLHR